MITGDGNMPRVRHYSYADAVSECDRLAKENTGIKFYILEAVEVMEQPSGIIRKKI